MLVDVAREMAEGEALDLRHGASLAAPQIIIAGGYEDAASSDVVVITAGLRRKPDESRLELINRNVALFRQIIADLKSARLGRKAILLVVSNPVDILTHLAVKESGLPDGQVIGLGTLLDTVRFRSLIAERFAVAAGQVDALILGEHGDSMVPVWSSATINGVAVRSFTGCTEEVMAEMFDATKKSGAEVIRLKGGAGYAVGLAIRKVVNAIALDSRELLPVSSLQSGMFGVRDVCLSVPTVIGRDGILDKIEIILSADEMAAMQNSGRVLAETLSKVE